MLEIFNNIENYGVVPVVKLDKTEYAVPLAEAVMRGGLGAVEITFRTECAADAVSLITSKVPDIIVGAGTILNVEQVKRAVYAGASFVVSPGFNSAVVEYCLLNGVPIIPGAVTPTEIEAVMQYGIRLIKFFPAQVYGGAAAIKALSAPYTDVKFMPTGGVSLENLGEYLALPSVFVCGGSYMVKESFMTDGNYAAVENLSRKSVEIYQKTRALQ